jgi:hypothetical protein
MGIISSITHPLLGVPIALLFGAIVMIWFSNADRSEYRWRELPILLSPAFCYLLLPVLGSLLAAEGISSGPRYHESTAYIPYILVILEVPLALRTVWRMRGVRVLMSVISGLLIWTSLIAGLYALMSITGRWL